MATESPRGSLLSTDIQQAVLRRTSTLCALCIARKSVAALTGLHGLSASTKACKQGMYASMSVPASRRFTKTE